MDDESCSAYHNFSQVSSPTHKLPTINGVQALFNSVGKHKPISTGLLDLDSALSSLSYTLGDEGGIARGSVTEVYGPPGSGKTHLGLQFVANALRQDDAAKVAWIDTASELPFERLRQFLAASTEPLNGQESQGKAPDDDSSVEFPDERLTYNYIASFPHLLALLLAPDEELLPEGTSLLIIDDLSELVLSGLPQHDKIVDRASIVVNGLSRDEIIHRSIAVRRASLLSALSSALVRLAALHSIAVVILNKTSSHRKTGAKSSFLRPALNVQQWNDSVATRVAVYRDFWPEVNWSKLSKEERRKQRKRERWPLRVASVEKLGGREVRADGVRFVIVKDRLHQVDSPRTIPIVGVVPRSSPLMRSEDNEEAMGKLGLEDVADPIDGTLFVLEDITSSASGAWKRTITEVADSEDEDEPPGKLGNERQFGHWHAQGGFLPSSQLPQAHEDGVRPSDSPREHDGPEKEDDADSRDMNEDPLVKE